MQEDILINWSPQETRVAVVENGALQELHVEVVIKRSGKGGVDQYNAQRVQKPAVKRFDALQRWPEYPLR